MAVARDVQGLTGLMPRAQTANKFSGISQALSKLLQGHELWVAQNREGSGRPEATQVPCVVEGITGS